MADCVLALGFEKMQRGSLKATVSYIVVLILPKQIMKIYIFKFPKYLNNFEFNKLVSLKAMILTVFFGRYIYRGGLI